MLPYQHILIESMQSLSFQQCYGSEYYIPYEGPLPPRGGMQMEHQFPYYRWTAVCLILQAFLFLLPSPIWSALQHICGVNLPGIIATATEVKAPDEASYKRHFRSLAGIIRGSCSGGSKLLICYIIFKALLIVNAIGQLLWINHWMGAKYGFLGLEKLFAFQYQNQTLLHSSTYPRVTLCSVTIRHVSRVHDYVIQCGMHLNAICEGFYILLWIWILCLVTINMAGLVNFLVTMKTPSWQRKYVTARMGATSGSNIPLSKDEYFIIRQVAAHNEVAATEILLGLEDDQMDMGGPLVNATTTTTAATVHPPPPVYPKLG